MRYFFVLSGENASFYFGGMEGGIKMRFAEKVMREEWRDFEKRHRDAIKRRTHRQSGRLEDDRSYKVEKDGDKSVTASFEHPVYERFLDMRKNYHGDIKKGIWTRREVLSRKGGRKIHNRIIFGKLNPLSFRLLNEFSESTREFVRNKFKKK